MKEKISERQLGNIRDMIRTAAKANVLGMSDEYLLNHMQRCVDEFNEWLDIVKAEAWEDGYIAGKAIGLYNGMKLIQDAKQKYREV